MYDVVVKYCNSTAIVSNLTFESQVSLAKKFVTSFVKVINYKCFTFSPSLNNLVHSLLHILSVDYICLRGFDRSTRFPKPLCPRFHCPVHKMKSTKPGKYSGNDNG